jgi:hypothetical protein
MALPEFRELTDQVTTALWLGAGRESDPLAAE